MSMMMTVSRRLVLALLAVVLGLFGRTVLPQGGGDCPYPPFYRPEELPNLHQLNLVIPQATFDSLVSHSNDRSFREQVGSLEMNDVRYEGVEIMVHGGDPQRGRHGKQSFRLKWSADDPFGAKHGVPFNFPQNNRCNNMKKLVLRAEWNDHPLANDPNGLMIRNKISQDIIKKAGGQTPREDFCEFSVNGHYFGLYGLEEHVSEEFMECQGWDTSRSSLYKAQDASPSTRWQPSGPQDASGWERKVPGCKYCDNGGSTAMSCDEGDTGLGRRCDESSWPDKDHCLTCGDCKVLVNNFQSRYRGSCDTYCASIGKTCVGAWEESADDCQVMFPGVCGPVAFPGYRTTSDAICECSPDRVPWTPPPAEEAEGEPHVCECGTMAEDLHQLLGVVSDPRVTEDRLARVLNVTDFALWNIATSISMNVDTGAHNYNIWGPRFGTADPPGQPRALWRIVNIDADWGWGHAYCGNCRGRVQLTDTDGQRVSATGCPTDRSPQGPDLYNFCELPHPANPTARPTTLPTTLPTPPPRLTCQHAP